MYKRAIIIALTTITACQAVPEGRDKDARDSEYGNETQEIIENLRDAGFPNEEIGVLEDGTVYVGLDAVVTLEASRELVGTTSHGDVQDRQYSTNNIVSPSIGTICIDGSEFDDTGLGVLSPALDGAIENYNAQNLSFRMVRTTGANTGCDAEIAANLINGGGGIAGLPSGGVPYGEINIGINARNYPLAVTRHLIMHELGHTVGFRHSDWYNRRISCGNQPGPSNEGVTIFGANQIPGTPAEAVFNGSVMNACFNGGSTGLWTDTDVIALQALFGTDGGDDAGGDDAGGDDAGGDDAGGDDAGGDDAGGDDSGGGGSCQDRCGEYDQLESCQCDDQCVAENDCWSVTATSRWSTTYSIR